jgi:hypothetical protein
MQRKTQKVPVPAMIQYRQFLEKLDQSFQELQITQTKVLGVIQEYKMVQDQYKKAQK